MSYFTEILADSGDGFRALDADVRDANDLDDLVDMMRSAAGDDGEAVAVIEHEDEWFGLVRLCSNNEVKIFLSDLAAVEASPFAEIFADFLDSRPDAYDAEPEEDFGAEEDEGTIAEDDDDDDDESRHVSGHARVGELQQSAFAESAALDLSPGSAGARFVESTRSLDKKERKAARKVERKAAYHADAEWGGDADIYSDRGVPAATLIDQVESYRSDPARVVAHVGETVGFADQLEAAR